APSQVTDPYLAGHAYVAAKSEGAQPEDRPRDICQWVLIGLGGHVIASWCDMLERQQKRECEQEEPMRVAEAQP
ncbi:hypothetical protein, partial [Algiphilus sp.]|uniref:hypothetical protein n=1 Tax=Algiphilus sp. TaxID=1872431 RepID=UPI003C618BFB